eukprot:6182720-Pleurochrysis_carterae.AAC.3
MRCGRKCGRGSVVVFKVHFCARKGDLSRARCAVGRSVGSQVGGFSRNADVQRSRTPQRRKGSAQLVSYTLSEENCYAENVEKWTKHGS